MRRRSRVTRITEIDSELHRIHQCRGVFNLGPPKDLLATSCWSLLRPGFICGEDFFCVRGRLEVFLPVRRSGKVPASAGGKIDLLFPPFVSK